MRTPAQVYGHPTLNDVPVQGPTDPGIRAADCWFTQNVVRQKSGCVDCHGGVVPQWATTKGIGLEGTVSIGGRAAVGFGAVGDPDIFSNLSADQQHWVMNALNDLNTHITTANPGNACPDWASDIVNMTKCFHTWWNKNYSKIKTLRTDGGVFDKDTFDALKLVVSWNPADFASLPANALTAPVAPASSPLAPPPVPAAAPSPVAPVAQAVIAPAAAVSEGMGTGAKIGIAAAGVAVLGIAYAATRKRK
jgi:hypothetical protein